MSGIMLEKIRKGPINYFSDLFIAAMVAAWIITIAAMIVMAVYSTVINRDNSIWSDLGILVAAPLSAGGAVWMIKNSVQHAIANKAGRRAEMDFPAVDAPEEDGGTETPMEDHSAGSGKKEEKESEGEMG